MWISKQEWLDSQQAQQHPVGTSGTIQWSTPWHSTLATGRTETFCGSSPAFLGLPLKHRFHPPARPLTTKKLSPPAWITCTWRGMAVHTCDMGGGCGKAGQCMVVWGASWAWPGRWESQPACSGLFPLEPCLEPRLGSTWLEAGQLHLSPFREGPSMGWRVVSTAWAGW